MTDKTAQHRRRWLRPQVLVSLLFFLASLGFFLSALVPPQIELTEVVLENSEARVLEQVSLVLVQAGERRVSQQSLSLPTGDAERVTIILGALAETDVWPEGLSVPTAFVFRDAQRVTAVLNFPAPTNTEVSATEEWDLLRSLRATLREQGVNEIRLLIEGQVPVTFLGHVKP